MKTTDEYLVEPAAASIFHTSTLKTLLAAAFSLMLLTAAAYRTVAAAPGADPTNESGSFMLNPDNYGFWSNVKSPEQFEGWRKAVIAFYHKATGLKNDFQPPPLDIVVTETISISDKVERRRIEYNTTDGLKIPAYLFVPKTDKPVPVIIVYHGHGEGKIAAAEKEGTNENALARYLAEKLGYVVLAPDTRSFGEFKIPRSESHIDYYFSLFSKNKYYMEKLMEDGYQDLALLRSIPQADMKRLGVAGISMGSWRAFNFAALHEEAAATVISGLYISWDYLFSEKHCRCQHMPKLAKKIAAEDLAATIFPRHIMIQWGLEDKFHTMGAEPMIEKTTKIAGFLGCPDSFTVDRHPGMGHRFSNPEIADFFHKLFGAGAWGLTAEK